MKIERPSISDAAKRSLCRREPEIRPAPERSEWRWTSRIHSVTASLSLDCFATLHITMMDFGDRNVFEMAVANDGPGFWIRRTTWGNTCARVVGIGRFTKPAPYFGNPPVVMDVYSLAGELKDELASVQVPGTYKTWRKIDPPEWAASKPLRPLSDAAISMTIQKLDRRR
jgi:hypothetical protein